MARKTIKVDYLARVEGEGALHVSINGNEVEDVRLEIFEPPRFFEAFLQERDYKETPDIVARICGICPVAYQMSAVYALENLLDIKVTGPLHELRRLLYCGEWIESHVLHIYMLHAPDFLGYESAIAMAKDHKFIVERGLQLKKAGNAILQTLGGREIHPINIKVGGFYKLPSKSDLRKLGEELKWARDAALETVHWVAGLDFPNFEREYEFVSLQHDNEYPMNKGRIVSSKGLDINVTEYENFFQEKHNPHSTALHSVLKDRGTYFVGPMARFNLNNLLLRPIVQEVMAEIDFKAPCNNPFKSIIVRALEVLHACDEALEIIEQYSPDGPAAIEHEVKAGTGYGCTEAPRGILYHRYELDENGSILVAKIVPPTSQNQGMIEEDLRDLIERYTDLNDADLQWRCEQSIRNYDPCISCSTHFLKLNVDRK